MKWLKRAFWASSVVVVAILATALVLRDTGNLPYKVYVVHTGSMYPAIPSGSAVIVREGKYHLGEVISFKVHGTIVTHRLVAIRPNGTTVTKGDANSTADPWHVPTSNIIGKVVAAPRMLGYFLVYIKKPLGIVSIAAALFLVWLVWLMSRGLFRKKPNGDPTDAPVPQA